MYDKLKNMIPGDMRIQNRWVTLVAHKEPDGGIIRKSYQPGTDRHAKVDDPQTWTDFKSACRYCKRDHHSGIGFALGDGFCGIILSDCRDPKTRRIEPWADEVIKLIQSYSEVSPSGKGIHIICRANLPEGVKNKTDRFSIYDQDHFFSITGDRLKDSPCGVEERQKKLEQLLGGVIQEHDSAKDQLNDNQIKNVDTSETLENVADVIQASDKIADNSLTDNSLITGEQLLRTQFESKQFIIESAILPCFGYTILAGPTKGGKSFLALQMCMSILSGKPFLNMFKTNNPGKILYVNLEIEPESLQKRLREMQKTLGSSEGELKNLVFQTPRGLNILTQNGKKQLIAAIEDSQARLVVIDPISLVYGDDINNYKIVTKFATILKEVSDKYDCAILVIHHFGKPGIVKRESSDSVIGSSAWSNFAEGIIGISRYSKTKSPEYKVIDFKLRHGADLEPIVVKFNKRKIFEPKEFEEVNTAIPIEYVAEFLREYSGEANYTTLNTYLRNELGISKRKASDMIRNAREAGLIDKGPGKFDKYFINNIN